MRTSTAFRRLGPIARRDFGQRPRNAIPSFVYRFGFDRGNTEPNDPETRSAGVARLEAALFLADEPLTVRRLTEVAGLKDATETRRMLAQLREHFQSTSGAIRIEEIAGGYQFLTAESCQLWLGRIRKPGHIARLSPSAMETLTVVAYKQPLTRADIDAVRGIDCRETVSLLLEQGLVRTVGRQDSLGRPQLYGTSKHFLQILGFQSLDELPLSDV